MGQRLWRQAERDLKSARMMLQPHGYYVAANPSHQAAEKALKAAHWHVRGEEAQWTHDLRNLVERVVDRPEEIPATVNEAVSLLVPVFERTRYPSGEVNEPIPADLVREEDAQMCLSSAQEVMRWTGTLLLGPPGKTRRRRNS